MTDADQAAKANNEPSTPRPWQGLSVVEIMTENASVREYVGDLEARLAAVTTQLMVMRDEEAQRVKLKAIDVLITKNRNDEEMRSRKAMESIGISTHWSYTAGKTVGAMTLELVELVKSLRATPPTKASEQ